MHYNLNRQPDSCQCHIYISTGRVHLMSRTHVHVYLSVAGHVEGQMSPSSERIKGDIWTLYSFWKQEILIQPHYHLHRHENINTRSQK